MKAMYQYEVAAKAGVSDKTFRRWLKPIRQELQAMGLNPRSKLIPGHIVEYLARQFCIDIETRPR